MLHWQLPPFTVNTEALQFLQQVIISILWAVGIKVDPPCLIHFNFINFFWQSSSHIACPTSFRVLSQDIFLLSVLWKETWLWTQSCSVWSFVMQYCTVTMGFSNLANVNSYIADFFSHSEKLACIVFWKVPLLTSTIVALCPITHRSNAWYDCWRNACQMQYVVVVTLYCRATPRDLDE